MNVDPNITKYVIKAKIVTDGVELMQGVKNASTIISGGVISQRFVDIAFNIGVKSIFH